MQVVHAYHSSFSGGIGDFLRGSDYLYKECKTRGHSFHIDWSKHPISKHLCSSCKLRFNAREIIDLQRRLYEVKSGFAPCTDAKELINDLLSSDESNLYLSTYYSDLISGDLREKMRSFTMDEEEASFFRESINFSAAVKGFANNIKEYAVVHLRLGDREMFGSSVPLSVGDKVLSNLNFKDYRVCFEACYEEIEKRSKDHKKILVFSDSNKFKKFVHSKNNPKVIVVHKKSAHTSKNPGLFIMSDFSLDTAERDFFYAALDMRLMSKAEKIYSYSVYNWGSGFSFWLSKIFNVPLEAYNIPLQLP